MKEQNLERVAELDSLRALAAICIVIYHFSYPSEAYYKYFYVLGPLALELFFCLSGFLITAIILKHGQRPGFLKTFYLRRGLRIWPIYYLMILLGAVEYFVKPTLVDLTALPYYLTYTQNFPLFWGTEQPILVYWVMHTWSLAVEEQFYLIWPILIILTARRGPKALVIVMAGVALSSLILRLGGMNAAVLPARCDGFALGGLAAMFLQDPALNRPLFHRIFTIAIIASLSYLTLGMMVCGALPFDYSRDWPGAFAVLANSTLFASIIGLVIMNQGGPRLAWLRNRWLQGLGTISYGIYLYHLLALLIGVGLANRFSNLRALEILLASAVVLVVSILSWRLIEKPLLSLKSRLPYGPPTVMTNLESPLGAEAKIKT